MRAVRHPYVLVAAHDEQVPLVCWVDKDISLPPSAVLPSQAALRRPYEEARRAKKIPASTDEDFFNKAPTLKDYVTGPARVQIDVVFPFVGDAVLCLASTPEFLSPLACLRYLTRPKEGEDFLPYSRDDALSCARRIVGDSGCGDSYVTSFLNALTNGLM